MVQGKALSQAVKEQLGQRPMEVQQQPPAPGPPAPTRGHCLTGKHLLCCFAP